MRREYAVCKLCALTTRFKGRRYRGAPASTPSRTPAPYDTHLPDRRCGQTTVCSEAGLQPMRFLEAKHYDSGVILLRYAPEGAVPAAGAA